MTEVAAAVTVPAAPPATSPAAPSTPLTPAEAASKLATLRTDNAWGDRVLKGEPGALKELRDLSQIISTGSDLDVLILNAQDAPDLNIDGQLSPKKIAGEIPALRAAGISDPTIRELLEGRVPTPQEIDAVSRFQKMRHGDQAWVTKYLAGDHEAVRESKLMSMVLMMRPT
jgi:hypothetical protein